MDSIPRSGNTQPRGWNKGICCLLLVQADYISRARGRGPGIAQAVTTGVPAEHFMQMSVGHGGPARGQARKL